LPQFIGPINKVRLFDDLATNKWILGGRHTRSRLYAL
jgi:hypothetical protein